MERQQRTQALTPETFPKTPTVAALMSEVRRFNFRMRRA